MKKKLFGFLWLFLGVLSWLWVLSFGFFGILAFWHFWHFEIFGTFGILGVWLEFCGIWVFLALFLVFFFDFWIFFSLLGFGFFSFLFRILEFWLLFVLCFNLFCCLPGCCEAMMKKGKKNIWVPFLFLGFWLLGTLRFEDFGLSFFVFFLLVFPGCCIAPYFLLALSILELEFTRIVEGRGCLTFRALELSWFCVK